MSPLFAIFFIWFLPVSLLLITHRNEPDFVDLLILVIPGLSLFGYFSIIETVMRGIKSEGKCIFGHKFVKIKINTSFRMRAPIGGFDDYQCVKCKCNRTIKWSAF